jgi:hypothetical protein
VIFGDELTVTIQQIGAVFFGGAADEAIAAYEVDHPVAGEGWVRIGDPARVGSGVSPSASTSLRRSPTSRDATTRRQAASR